MPNNLVFNGTADQLKTQIHGAQTDNTITPIRVDSEGRMEVATVTANVANTVTVTATNFDIRPLTSDSDSIQLGGRLFTETSTSIADATGTGVVLTETTSEYSMYTYYIANTGSATVTVKLQISPTTADTYFTDDPSGEIAVAPGTIATLVPQRFLKHTRLYYDSGAETASFEAYFNGQV